MIEWLTGQNGVINDCDTLYSLDEANIKLKDVPQ